MTVHIDYQEEIAHWDALIDILQTAISLLAERRQKWELALRENIDRQFPSPALPMQGEGVADEVVTVVRQWQEIRLWAAIDDHFQKTLAMARSRRERLDEVLR